MKFHLTKKVIVFEQVVSFCKQYSPAQECRHKMNDCGKCSKEFCPIWNGDLEPLVVMHPPREERNGETSKVYISPVKKGFVED
jgi:hypothetical protein